MNSIEITGEPKQRRMWIANVAQLTHCNSILMYVNSLIFGDKQHSEEEILRGMNKNLEQTFKIRAEKAGFSLNFPKGFAHYIDSKNIMLHCVYEIAYKDDFFSEEVTIELRKQKTHLVIRVEDDEYADRLFMRLLYNLAERFECLSMPITINGDTYRLANHLAASMCKYVKDNVGYRMYHDEGLEMG